MSNETKTQHTPGPWKRRWSHETRGDGSTIETGRIHGARDVKIAELALTANVDADARLIAAAPELLEALKETERALAVSGTPCALDAHACRLVLHAAHAAIEKAEGKS